MTDDKTDLNVNEYLRDSDGDSMVKVIDLEKIQRLVAEDHVVDQKEVELLFSLNQHLGAGDESNAGWAEFFVGVVARAVVFDMDSPGEIDENEGNWLGELFEKYSVENQSETMLVEEIKKTASCVKGKLGQLIA